MFDLYSDLYSQPSGWMLFGLIIIITWETIWKSIALWFSAKNKQKGWFIILIIFNTFGLLPIIYIIWFRPKNETERNNSQELEIEEEIEEKQKKFSKKVIKPANKKLKKK